METWTAEPDQWLATLQNRSSLTPEERADLADDAVAVQRYSAMGVRT